jgi:RecA-family ATPase
MLDGEGHRIARYAEQGAALSLSDGSRDLDAADEIKTLDWRHLATIQPQPKAFTIPNFAPAGELTLFTGAGSAGKSLFAQQVCTAMAAGVPTLGLTMEKAPAIYLTCEDDAAQLHWRQDHICRALGLTMASLAGSLHIATLRGEIDNALAIEGPDGFQPTPAYHRLTRLVRSTGAKLVALDNVAHLFTGNENDRGEVTRFANLLNRLAGETGAAILLIGHPNKAGDSYSGSTAWPNAVRSHIFLQHCEATDVRTLTAGKANYGRKGEEIRFAWTDWAFTLEADLPPDTAARLAETARAQFANEAFLSCLRARGAGREVGPNLATNYAPARFAEMPEAKGLAKVELAKAMERLLHLGVIEVRQVKHKGSQTKSIIAEVEQ